jgi:hypothetical protein
MTSSTPSKPWGCGRRRGLSSIGDRLLESRQSRELPQGDAALGVPSGVARRTSEHVSSHPEPLAGARTLLLRGGSPLLQPWRPSYDRPET